YKLPAGFHKALVLFNLHRSIAKSPAGDDSTVVLVEGFFDCMKVWQAGYACVALMGSSMSQQQHELLYKHFRQVILMLDGDEAGRAATKEVAGRLIYSHLLRAVSLTGGVQPDRLSTGELQRALSFS